MTEEERKERLREYNRAWYAKNAKKRCEISRRWNAKNAEKRHAYYLATYQPKPRIKPTPEELQARKDHKRKRQAAWYLKTGYTKRTAGLRDLRTLAERTTDLGDGRLQIEITNKHGVHQVFVSKKDYPMIDHKGVSLAVLKSKHQEGDFRTLLVFYLGKDIKPSIVSASFPRVVMGLGRYKSNRLVVDHLDNNPLNNTRENLEAVTQSENMIRAFARSREKATL